MATSIEINPFRFKCTICEDVVDEGYLQHKICLDCSEKIVDGHHRLQALEQIYRKQKVTK
jgi:hypothetical protein